MASPTEVKPGAPGFGARRWLVRGTIMLPEEVHRELRPAYNEYPERYPVFPGFPSAGQRGGSRARRAVGEAAGAGEGEAGAGGLLPPATYPVAREREVSSGNIRVNPSMPQAPEGAPYSGLCQYPEGDTFVISLNSGVAAGAIAGRSIPLITRAFVVTHVNWWHAGGNNVDVEMRIYAAQNSSAPVAMNESGVNIINMQDTRGLLDPNAFSNHAYPNKYFVSPPWALKAVLRNGTAGGVDFSAVIDLVYL